MLIEGEKNQLNSFETGGIKIPIEMMPDLPEDDGRGEASPEKTPEEMLEEKRAEFAQLDLEAERWMGERDKMNFWDKEGGRVPATKENFGENENKEYFQKKKEYLDALKSYREKKFQVIDSQDIPDEERQKRKNEVIKETVAMEANRLYDTKISLSIEAKDDSLKEKAKELSGKAIDWYRKLPLKHKIGFSAALFGTGLGAGVMGGAAGVALATGVFLGTKTQRILGGSALAVGLEAGIHRRQENKAEREVAEMFAKKIKEKMTDINNEMSEKLFELEGRKSVEMYKRYILSGAAGFFVGSGVAGKALFSVAEMFGINADSVKETAAKGFDKFSGWLGISEASAESISEGVLDQETDQERELKVSEGAGFDQVKEGSEYDLENGKDFEGKEPSFEFIKLDFVNDEHGNIEGIDYRGNFLYFDPRSFIDFSAVEESGRFGLEDKTAIEDTLKEMKIFQQALEKLQTEGRAGGPEYRWVENNLSEGLEDLKERYGHFLKMDKIGEAFSVKETPELETSEPFNEPLKAKIEEVPEQVEMETAEVDKEELSEVVGSSVPPEPIGELDEADVTETSVPVEKELTESEERTSEIDEPAEVGKEEAPEFVELDRETEAEEGKVDSLESAVSGLEKDISELSEKVTKNPEKEIVAEIEPDEPDEPDAPLPEFVSSIQPGSSVWKTTESILTDNFTDEFNGLSESQQNNLIKQIEVRVAEDPAKFGLEGVQDIHKVQAGQRLDLSPLMEGEEMSRMIELAKSVTEQIEGTVEPEPAPGPEPEISLPTEEVVTETASEETTPPIAGVDFEEPTLKDVVEPEDIKPHPTTEEAIPDTTGIEFEEPAKVGEEVPEDVKPGPIVEPVSQIGGIEFEEAVSEYPKFASEIEQGSSVWKTTEGILKDNFGDEFNSLDEARQTHLIDQIKNKIAEDPSGFGLIEAQDIDQVQPGQRLDLSPLMEGETMNRMLESSANLNQEDVTRIINNNEKIEAWVKENPNKALTTERVQEIIKGTVEERVGIDSEAQTISRIMELYDIAENESNIEAVKLRLDIIGSMDLDVSTKKALADLYFENWNKEGISQERVEGVLSEFLGESYEDNKEFFRDGGNICKKEENGDIEIALEKTGLSDQKGKELLITVSPQGTISLDGPSGYWNIGEKSLNDRSLTAVEKRLSDFANA